MANKTEDEDYQADFESSPSSSARKHVPETAPETKAPVQNPTEFDTVPNLAAESVSDREDEVHAAGKENACAALVGFDNFNPFDPLRPINSPRSLEVCRVHGIDPTALFHKSYEEIKGIVIPIIK